MTWQAPKTLPTDSPREAKKQVAGWRDARPKQMPHPWAQNDPHGQSRSVEHSASQNPCTEQIPLVQSLALRHASGLSPTHDEPTVAKNTRPRRQPADNNASEARELTDSQWFNLAITATAQLSSQATHVNRRFVKITYRPRMRTRAQPSSAGALRTSLMTGRRNGDTRLGCPPSMEERLPKSDLAPETVADRRTHASN